MKALTALSAAAILLMGMSESRAQQADDSLDSLLGPPQSGPAAPPLAQPATPAGGAPTSTEAAPDAKPEPNSSPESSASTEPSVPAVPGTAPDAAATTEASAAPKKRRETNRAIEEIVVTARKREENISDVPIAIAAFSGAKLDALGVGNPKALPQITPGLQYDSLVGYSVVYLRGVGTDLFTPNADPSVSTYIDGVYLPFSHGLASDFGKLSRVEVLKGPQGTLFGRNSTGGAISVVTAKPNHEEIEGSLSAEFGSYSTRNYKAYISGPLTDTLAVGISVIDDGDKQLLQTSRRLQVPTVPGRKINWT